MGAEEAAGSHRFGKCALHDEPGSTKKRRELLRAGGFVRIAAEPIVDVVAPPHSAMGVEVAHIRERVVPGRCLGAEKGSLIDQPDHALCAWRCLAIEAFLPLP